MNDCVDMRDENGFTLLETIIAFLILSLSLAITVQTISQGGLTFRRATDLQTASLMMEELNANEIGNLKRDGVSTGSVGDGEWKMTARAIDDKYPGTLLVVEIEIRPSGDEGPVFNYVTLATAEDDTL